MSKNKDQTHGKDQEIDRLLLETLREDLPASLEVRMQSHWEAFQDKAAAEEDPNRYTVRERTGSPFSAFLLGSQRILARGALAAAAVAMIVWGALLQAGGSSNVLAKNLNLLQTTVLVKDQVSLSSSLTCRIEIETEQNRDMVYQVQWLPPNLQRVDVWDRAGNPIRTVWVRDRDITVADRRADTTYSVEELGQIEDPYLPAILKMLRPLELADRLHEGEWKEKGRELRENCVWSTFQIASLDERRDTFDMTVDLCDYRPVEIQRVLDSTALSQRVGGAALHFRLQWNIPIPIQHMIPEKQTAPREV